MESQNPYCNICNVNISSAHFSRHFKSKKHLQNEHSIEIYKLRERKS